MRGFIIYIYERIETVNIALLAHDNKKELMVQFCIAYCGILAEHSICATATTGKLVSEATGLTVTQYLSGPQGGTQQINARITFNEIDLVLCFGDPKSKDADKEIIAIARSCDIHSIPFASNVATAEVLIQGLKRGDFGWRDIVNPKR
jgi:methylglyoxal synthase